MVASVRPAAVADSDGRHLGSAFRISNNLLLTAQHMLLDTVSTKLKLLGTDEFMECATEWEGNVGDLAVAILRVDNTKGDRLPDIETVDIGQFIGIGRRDCDVTGYSMGYEKSQQDG